MTEHRDQILRIERAFEAPIEKVFDAWTSEEVLCRWLHCGPDWETPTAEVDLRVGGRIRIVMLDPDGVQHGAAGAYQLIERPHRLVFSWTFDDHADNEQLIELKFSEREGVTTVEMINSGIASDGMRADQEIGWHACYEILPQALSAS